MPPNPQFSFYAPSCREGVSVLKKSPAELSAGSKRPKTILWAPQQEQERVMKGVFNTLGCSRKPLFTLSDAYAPGPGQSPRPRPVRYTTLPQHLVLRVISSFTSGGWCPRISSSTCLFQEASHERVPLGTPDSAGRSVRDGRIDQAAAALRQAQGEPADGLGR